MASSYTDIGTELMTTGENAGTWGSTTNTNIQILEEAVRGYVAVGVASADATLSLTDGSTGDSIRNMVIAFTGTLAGNRVITVPAVEKMWVMDNQTGGAYTLTVKASGQTGVTWAATDKGTKILYANGTDVIDTDIGGVGSYDLNGEELTLDADSDTSITASTDDQIDFEIAGADDFTMTANAFNVLTGSHATFADSANAKFGTGNDMLMYHDGSNSYITNATGALKLATETSGIALTIGHTTSETTIADNLTVSGTLTGTLATAAQGSVTSLGTLTTLTVDNIITNGATIGHTSDTDLLTLADGALTVAGTIGSGAITSTGIVTGTAFTAGSAVLAEAELELLDGLTAGTAIASKVVTTDSSIDTTGQRNLTISGELDAATGDFSGDVDVDGTLEADAITINGTAIGSIYGVVAGSSSILTTGALDSGSITSGFGAIDNGTSNIRSATITAETAFVPDASGGADLGTTALEFNDLFLNDSGSIQFGDDQDTTLVHTDGTGLTLNSTNKLCFYDTALYIHSSTDGQLDLVADTEIQIAATTIDINGAVALNGAITGATDITLSGELDAATLDISGNADIDGTTNLDAVDIDGAVQIDGATTVGVDGTGLDVKFFGDTAGSFLLWDQSADALLLTDSTPIQIGDAQDLTLYHDGSNSYITNAVGALKVATETSGIAVTIGHTTSETTIADNLTVTGTLTGTLATAAQGSVTSLGTLTTLTVDNIITNGTTIGHTDDTDLITLADGALTVAGTIGSGAITSTGIVTGTAFTAGSAVLAEAELELLDGLTAGTAIASCQEWGLTIDDDVVDRVIIDLRKKAYPTWQDQLDYIYHNSVDDWKTNIITPIKEKYPKK